MTRRVTRTPQAIDDLAGIAAYLAPLNPYAAKNLLAQLDGRSQMLAEQPGIGRPFRRRTRLFVFGDYLIVYRETSDGIEVIRYYHGRRDRRRL